MCLTGAAIPRWSSGEGRFWLGDEKSQKGMMGRDFCTYGEGDSRARASEGKAGYLLPLSLWWRASMNHEARLFSVAGRGRGGM